MTKSSTPKGAAKKVRETHHKTPPQVVAEKAHVQRKTASKVATGKARDTDRKTVAETSGEKAHATHRKTAAAENVLGTNRKIAAQFGEFRDTQGPDIMRAFAERSVAQTRDFYDRSKNSLQAVLESWAQMFGPAGQGAVALNRKIIDIAERNINAGFDLATSLAGARNLAEVMELQAAYWRRQVGDLSAQAEELRALSAKVTANKRSPSGRG